MTIEHRIRPAASAAGLLLICLTMWLTIGLAAAPAAWARSVSVTWTEGAANATVRDRAGALQSAFRTAVFREAMDILPGPIDEERQSLLWDFLADRSGDWVQSYSETGRSEQPAPEPSRDTEAAPQAGPVRTVTLDVQVNRAAVKQALRRIGVYYTTAAPWPFELRLSGDAGEAWVQLGDLQRLTGLVAGEGVEPVLSLSRQAASAPQGQEAAKDGEEAAPSTVWSGSLLVDGNEWTAWGPDLATVWFDLWGRFFSRPEVEAGLVRTTVLVMDGWFTPDGVRAFDAVLRGWESEVEEATLVGLTATAGGMEARWLVKTLDAQTLERRLAAYAPDRGLTWRLGR